MHRWVTGPYNFSPSRINHILSLTITCVWLLLAADTTVKKGSCEGWEFWFAIALGATTIAGAVGILFQRSHAGEVRLNVKGNTRTIG
jgi:hypothetical protein